MIEKGKNEDHDKMNRKDKGQLVVVKEEKRSMMGTSKKVQ
jgi:hypothetical protein